MTYIQEITFQEAFNQYDKSYMETCPESQGRRGLGGEIMGVLSCMLKNRKNAYVK